MLSQNVLALLGLASTTLASTIPGVFTEVHGAESPVNITELLPRDDGAEPATPEECAWKYDGSYERCGGVYMWCGCGVTLNQDDVSTARDALISAFEAINWEPRQSMGVVYNGLVAFACDATWPDWAVMSGPIENAFSEIGHQCGNVAGSSRLYWAGRDGFETKPVIGIMKYYDGLDPCAHARDSNQPYCSDAPAGSKSVCIDGKDWCPAHDPPATYP